VILGLRFARSRPLSFLSAQETGIAACAAEYSAMFSVLTTAINALLLLLTAAAPLAAGGATRAGKWRGARDYWLRSALGIGIGVALAESGKRYEIWSGHPSFPSGHETVALAAGTCLAAAEPRWLYLALPLAGVQAWALVAGHFHYPWDIAGALLTGLLPPLACHWVKRPAPS